MFQDWKYNEIHLHLFNFHWSIKLTFGAEINLFYKGNKNEQNFTNRNL